MQCCSDDIAITRASVPVCGEIVSGKSVWIELFMLLFRFGACVSSIKFFETPTITSKLIYWKKFKLFSVCFSLKALGFNQKLHLVVDIFRECLKSLANDSDENQFRVAVQQQLKDNEFFLNQPASLSGHLSFNATRWHIPTIYEKSKCLRAITFGDFQEYCRKFGEEMKIKALIQGNVTESHALGIMNTMLSDLNFRKIEDVSAFHSKIIQFHFMVLLLEFFSHLQLN